MAVLITIQSMTSAPVTRHSAVLLNHVGEHALTWTASGLVGTSRVALGVHHPSDVLAGSLVGAALARWVVPTPRVPPS